MTDSKSRPKYPEGTVVDDYQIQSHIGSGGFGDIYTVINLKKPELPLAAMKVEYLDAEKQGLEDEIEFLEKLQDSNYFPKFIASGKTNSCIYLVMELLGPSVSTMRRACEGRHYSTYSLLKIAAEMVKCIEDFHSHGFVHRDIKPANFLIRANREHPVCLIDFGLSKLYINPVTKAHIPFSDDAGFTGTCRYASVHAHDNFELSRRDDLLSWFYSTIELAEGRVPWPGSKDRDLTEEMKKKSRAAELCKGLPDEFIEIYRRLRALKFEEAPPYAHILMLIHRAIDRLCSHPYLFDWEVLSEDTIKSISFIPLTMPREQSDEPVESESKSEEQQQQPSETIPEPAEGGCACRI